MMKGFRVSNLIYFNISTHYRNNNNNNHLYSPFLSTFFSSSFSSYNNDGYSGGRPPPRRRSRFIEDNERHVSSQYTGRGRQDFDTNQKPNYYYHSNDTKSRPSNRSDNRKSLPKNININSNTSYVPFNDDDDDDDENNLRFSSLNPRKGFEDNKVKDVDGFLERFKLGLDQEDNNSNKVKFEKLGSGRGTGEGDGEEEEEGKRPPEDADEIFRKMKETGLIPNAVAMLHGLCSDGLVQEAMKLFGVMRERGSVPEVVIYTAVVEGFCKAQKPDEAIRIFRKMQGNGIVPNAFSYGVLVQGLVKGKQLDDCFEFCLEMVEAGHSPNLATFTGLVDAFCRERGLEAAQIVIGRLKDKGFGFDEKGVRDFMEKKGPFSPMVWEAIFGKKSSQIL